MRAATQLFLIALLFTSALLPLAQGKDCSVALFKTYTPRGPGKAVCDSQNLPAEFAGDLATLSSGLASLGYKAKQIDQCANGTDDTGTTYSLVSQLGDCVQTGAALSCKLYVSLYSEETSVFENTISGVGFGSVTLRLSEALSGLPRCDDL